VALPLLAAARAAWEFFSERVVLAKWDTDTPLVEIGAEPVKPAAPETPPAPTV
jgi:hypothetical protein